MHERLRAIIVDDEPLAREGLRLRLGWIPDVEIIAECGTSRSAIDAIRRHAPDVIFLDIQMPVQDGFALLEGIERDTLPAVVFVTAFAEHAVQAFRVGALDYLVKPFDDETLRASTERVRAYVAVVRERERRAATAVSAADDARSPLVRLAVRDGDCTVFVATGDIDWLESAGDYVRVHAQGKAYAVRATMEAMQRRLDPARFIRLHRGIIAAIDAIRELQPYSRGEFVARLIDGATVPLSRRQHKRVRAALEQPRSIPRV